MYPRESRRKGEKEKEQERKTMRCFEQEQTVATACNKHRLLTWQSVLEETKRRVQNERRFVETVGIRPGPLGKNEKRKRKY